MQLIAHTIPRVLGELLRRSPMSPGKVDFAWKTAVGPGLDRVTSVRLEGATLIVEAKTPQWTREVSRSSHVILTRMQQLLGPDVVREIAVRA